MTTEEKQLLIAVAQAVLQCARWGQNTGIDQVARNALSAALAQAEGPSRAETVATDGHLPPSPSAHFDLLRYLRRQRVFSEKTCGPGTRAKGIVDHIRKELIEVEQDPRDLKEWIDVVTLALDGAWRAGHSPEQIAAQLDATLTRNEARTWPDWRTMPADGAIEHDRSRDQ